MDFLKSVKIDPNSSVVFVLRISKLLSLMCVLQSAYVDYLYFQHLFTVLLFSGNYFEKHPGNLSN